MRLRILVPGPRGRRRAHHRLSLLRERVGSASEAYLGELVRRLRERLGAVFCGGWLIGSAALGDFDAARSDLDVQAVSGARLRPAELERLAAALSHESLPCPVRGLELVVYAREDLSATAPPRFQLNLNSGPQMNRHVGLDPGAEPGFWFVLDVSIARQAAIPLGGRTASDLLPELARDLVVAALRESLAWCSQEGEPAGAAQAACRAWAWAVEGRWHSKSEAVAWAAARVPDPEPLQRALALRAGRDAPPLEDAEVAPIVAAARAALG